MEGCQIGIGERERDKKKQRCEKTRVVNQITNIWFLNFGSY